MQLVVDGLQLLAAQNVVYAYEVACRLVAAAEAVAAAYTAAQKVAAAACNLWALYDAAKAAPEADKAAAVEAYTAAKAQAKGMIAEALKK